MYNKLFQTRKSKRTNEPSYRPGDRITFNAPIPWIKGEYKVITDVITHVYPNFLFTKKKYCVKTVDIRGHENVL